MEISIGMHPIIANLLYRHQLHRNNSTQKFNFRNHSRSFLCTGSSQFPSISLSSAAPPHCITPTFRGDKIVPYFCRLHVTHIETHPFCFIYPQRVSFHIASVHVIDSNVIASFVFVSILPLPAKCSTQVFPIVL